MIKGEILMDNEEPIIMLKEAKKDDLQLEEKQSELIDKLIEKTN